MKILVADDSKTFLTLITESLKSLGHEVIPVNSGSAAVEAFINQQPDLVILDVLMSGMDGFACARNIREVSMDDWIPIIFLSASINDESIALGIEAGGDDYLTKPYTDVVLEAKIKSMARISAMRQELLAKTEQLKKISATDALTGLGNRFYFEKVLPKKMAAALRHNFNIAVLFIDLDHFKTINDTFGHGVGDQLLKDVAQRLSKCTRMEDFIARIGGDEFVVILNQVHSHIEAGEIAAKIVAEVAKIYHINNRPIKISASVGVTCFPEQNGDIATVVRNADIAMYAAKQLGRNNFQYYTDELINLYRHQLGLEHELKFAIERKEISISYQPICNLLNKRIIGAEALARWNHPVFGDISPNVFIPIAEETGFISMIGLWILKQACQDGQKIIESGENDFILSVNVSVHQLQSNDFIVHLLEILDSTKMPPHNLEIELTESTAITYTKQLKDMLQEIHRLGIGISIDDFGTRYSSMTSLKNLPISTLKIDKEFIHNVDMDKRNNIIVKSLIALGDNLKLKVIAEGVETQDQAQYLIVNGCKLGQGNLMMKPHKFEKFLQLLKEYHLQVKG